MEESQPTAYEGIVIGLFPYADNDLVLKVIVREGGKMTLFARRAKQSKKRFGAPFDLFDHGFFGFRQARGSLLELEYFTPLRAFKNLRTNLTKLSIASTLCEAFDFLSMEQHENQFLYTCLSQGLSQVNDASDDRGAYRCCFETLAALLQDAGYASPQEFGDPSAHNLARVLHRIEQSAERQLKSKLMLVNLLGDLRRNVA